MIDDILMGKVDSLFEAIQLRDFETAVHCVEMARYSYWMAVEFDYCNRNQYYAAGLIHDVGKIGMADLILKGNSKLSKEDIPRVTDHVKDGILIMDNLNIKGVIRDIIAYHHERFDGSGYCDGLSGYDIPLPGRISAIADVYTTLVGGRRYASAKTSDEALTIMIKENYLFDRDILNWFVNNLKTNLSDNIYLFRPRMKVSWDTLERIG